MGKLFVNANVALQKHSVDVRKKICIMYSYLGKFCFSFLSALNSIIENNYMFCVEIYFARISWINKHVRLINLCWSIDLDLYSHMKGIYF